MAEEQAKGKRGRHILPDDYEPPSTAVEAGDDADASGEAESGEAEAAEVDEVDAVDSDEPDDEPDEEADEEADEVEPTVDAPAKAKVRHLDRRDRVVLIIGLVAVVVFGAVGGWIDYRAYRAHQVQPQRELFLEAGKRGAQNLTTIDYNHADADVKRVLDSATGGFFDDFSRRAPSFSDVVKQVKSKSTGTVTSAGVESISGDTAEVLVAVTVNTEVANGAPQPVRAFRMRLTMQKVGDDAKVSNVEFVQ